MLRMCIMLPVVTFWVLNNTHGAFGRQGYVRFEYLKKMFWYNCLKFFGW